MIDVFDLIARNRAGRAIGLPCFCTANEHVLTAILAYAAKTGAPSVIEATCNQVNQDGGYTNMRPKDFIAWLSEMAAQANVPMSQLILGGDHLGPNPWRKEPALQAMEKAKVLVRDYVEAGFTKIHLDASMACGGEPHPSPEMIAERTAQLCAIGEEYAPNPEKLFYIIGTEVPIPGGETQEPDALDITPPERLNETIATNHSAFEAHNLSAAWGRVVSVVTQPGVDFGHTSIYPFEPEKAAPLKAEILKHEGLTLEAHSTDYQSTNALAELVKKHFFFLKVGPELTFRLREAIMALADIESKLKLVNASNLTQIIAQRMHDYPDYWHDYYSGSAQEIETLKIYSYSDRIRYYWTDPAIADALQQMLENLADVALPETLVSQGFMGYEFGDIPNNAHTLIEAHITRCIHRYYQAGNSVE